MTKDFYLEQLGKLQVEDRKKVIDFLREVWDYYDENYSFSAFGTKDERIEFLQEVFLNPLTEALDEASAEIGGESLRQRISRKVQETQLARAKMIKTTKEEKEADDLPF